MQTFTVHEDDVWFTSDLHFNHENILKYQMNRAAVWGDDLEAMNEGLIEWWNTRVRPLDTVFVVGDFAMGLRSEHRRFYDRLQGEKILVRGNHDRPETCALFDHVFDVLHVRMETDDHGPQDLILNHYPQEQWWGMEHGSWHLHGHSHGALPIREDLLRIDVGVDTTAQMAPLGPRTIRSLLSDRRCWPRSVRKGREKK